MPGGQGPQPRSGADSRRRARWVQAREIKDISGLTHGVGWCAPQQGACKLTLNVKDGIIQEALVETIGCTGMTHSAAMAAEILPGKTILEALNTDLVCDAINTAMRELFLQIVYGRTPDRPSPRAACPSAPAWRTWARACAARSARCTAPWPRAPRYLEMAEGYVTEIGLDENDEIIGYEFVNLGKMMEAIKKGVDPDEALKKAHRHLRPLRTKRPRPSTRGTNKEEIRPWHCLKVTNEESARSDRCLAKYGIAVPGRSQGALRRQGRRRATTSSRASSRSAFENAVLGLYPGRAPSPSRRAQKKAADIAEALGEGLQAFCIPGSVADDRKVGIGHGNLAAMLLREETKCFCLPGRPRVLRRRRRRHRHRPARANKVRKDAAAGHPERPRQGRRPDHLAASTASPMCRRSSTTPPASSRSSARSPTPSGEKAKVRCYGADDVREGVAIMHHEGVDVSITGNSTNPTRFQHPVAGTYKKECIEQGKKYFSVASGGGTGRTLHPDNMAAGPASYGMTDTMGRMHSRRAVRRLLLRAGARRDDGPHRHGQQPDGRRLRRRGGGSGTGWVIFTFLRRKGKRGRFQSGACPFF